MRPSPSAKMRNFSNLVSRRSPSASVSPRSAHKNTSNPWPIRPTTSPSMTTRASQTRCTSASIVSAFPRAIARVAAPPIDVHGFAHGIISSPVALARQITIQTALRNPLIRIGRVRNRLSHKQRVESPLCLIFVQFMTKVVFVARPHLSHESLEPAPVLAFRADKTKPGASPGFEGIGGAGATAQTRALRAP